MESCTGILSCYVNNGLCDKNPLEYSITLKILIDVNDSSCTIIEHVTKIINCVIQTCNYCQLRMEDRSPCTSPQ